MFCLFFLLLSFWAFFLPLSPASVSLCVCLLVCNVCGAFSLNDGGHFPADWVSSWGEFCCSRGGWVSLSVVAIVSQSAALYLCLSDAVCVVCLFFSSACIGLSSSLFRCCCLCRSLVFRLLVSVCHRRCFYVAVTVALSLFSSACIGVSSSLFLCFCLCLSVSVAL